MCTECLYITLDQHGAAVLWHLDAAWQERIGGRSPFAEIAEDLGSWGDDTTMSTWSLPGSKVETLRSMIETLRPHLSDEAWAQADAKVSQLCRVAERSLREREDVWARAFPGRPLPELWTSCS